MRSPLNKARAINWGCVLPLVAYLAIAAALVIGAISLERHSTDPAPVPGAKFGVLPGNALSAELVRCQTLGSRAQDDRACLEAWRENRRRFFGGNPEPASSSNTERTNHP